MTPLLKIYFHLFIATALLAIFTVGPIYARTPDAGAILEAIDTNMSSKNRIFTSRMVIHGRRGSRTVASRTWAEGEKKSFTEYLAPAREKGVKMLKLEDKLWMYSPATDRMIQISGHMLRQSVMGSDLSYEDMMEDKKLKDHYEAVIEGDDRIDDRPCWVLNLTAKTTDVAYHKIKLWVDRDRLIPLKEELYAKTGRLLKKMELKDATKIQARWFPRRLIFKDMLKTGQGTEFIIEEIAFDQPIAAHIFSKAALKR
jgi:outer membrane lipoprotein-sorting protein